MTPITRRSPWLVAALSVLAVGAVFFATRHAAEARQLVAGAGDLDLRFAAFGLVVSAAAVFNRGLLNRASHRAVGLDAGAGAMTRTAAVGFAAQKMIKSAGAAGLAIFVRDGRRRGHAPGTVAAACMLSAASSFVALGVLLVTAIGVLVVTGRLTGWWIAAAVGFAIYAVAVTLLGTAIVRHRSAAVRGWSRCRHAWSRLTRRPMNTPVEATPDVLFAALDGARARPRALGSLLLHGVASKLLGALMLVTAVMSVGLPVGPGGAIVIYATALGASMVTIVPGGVGTVEGSTAALLVASGASVTAATLAVVLFRFFDLVVPVITGAVAARRPVTTAEPVPKSLPVAPPALVTAA